VGSLAQECICCFLFSSHYDVYVIFNILDLFRLTLSRSFDQNILSRCLQISLRSYFFCPFIWSRHFIRQFLETYFSCPTSTLFVNSSVKWKSIMHLIRTLFHFDPRTQSWKSLFIEFRCSGFPTFTVAMTSSDDDNFRNWKKFQVVSCPRFTPNIIVEYFILILMETGAWYVKLELVRQFKNELLRLLEGLVFEKKKIHSNETRT